MNFPLVSVCIPTYNNPLSVKRSIESVLMQTYTAIEIVITDDSSNYETENLVKEFFVQPFIRYIKNPIALGSPANWNEAVQHARGKYIKILHHDDWLATNNAIETFVTIAENTTYKNSLFFCNSTNVYNINNQKLIRPTTHFLNKVQKNPNTIIYHNSIGSPSICFFEKAYFFEFDIATRWYVDVIFYSEFLKKNQHQLVHIDKALVNITAGNASQLTQLIPTEEKFAEAIYCFKKYVNLENEHHTILFKISFIELVKRFSVTDAMWEKFAFTESEKKYLLPLYKFSKIPLPRTFYTIIRNILASYF